MSALSSYLIHPEQLNQESLYALRTLVARHPGYTAARLALLHNLFVLQDPSFSKELRKAAFLVPDRRVLFDLIEADKYTIEPEPLPTAQPSTEGRTLQVIDKFLGKTGQETVKRQPTVADATTDYAAFLLSLEDAPLPQTQSDATMDTTGKLVEEFLAGDGKFNVRVEASQAPLSDDGNTASLQPEQSKKKINKAKATETIQDDGDDSFFTETLAKIYIKQGRFEKALEIISTLSTNYPNKSIYFADQMRYLRKLIVNNQHKK